MLNHQTKKEIAQRVIELFADRYHSRTITVNSFLAEIVDFVVDQTAIYYKKNEYKFKSED